MFRGGGVLKRVREGKKGKRKTGKGENKEKRR